MKALIRNATLQRWRTPRFTRWVGSVAAVALLIAVSSYLAHQHKPLQTAGGADVVCEFCLQHTAPAGAPAQAQPSSIDQRAWRIVPPAPASPPRAATVYSYRSRAPPFA